MKINTCWCGLHDWKIVRSAQYDNTRALRLAIPSQRKRRVCKDCGKTQEEEKDCLGLQEGDKYIYTRHWVDVPRIEHDDNGKVELIVDGAGALLVYDEEFNTCYSLAVYKNNGPIELQGSCSKLGKYAISYPRT